MSRKRSIRPAVFATAIFLVSLLTGTPAFYADPPRKADQEAIQKRTRDLLKAIGKGDAKAVAAFWTSEGEHRLGDDQAVRGRDNIEKAYPVFLNKNPHHTVEATSQSVRFLSPDTAIETGFFRVQRPNPAQRSNNGFSALYVRMEGQWYLGMLREWRQGPSLEDLDWLVGTWVAKSEDAELRTVSETDGKVPGRRGYNCLFIGHSFFIPVARTFELFPAKYGVTNHRQQIVFSGGPGGSPARLWEKKRVAIEKILKTGQIDLLGMTYHGERNSSFEAYQRWVDLARKYNPKTKFFIGLPWARQPADTPIEKYMKTCDMGDQKLRARVARLRKAYPRNQFFYAEYSQASVTLKKLVEARKLPGLTRLMGRSKECLYRDKLGHANPPLLHLAALVWLRTLYGVDLNKAKIASPVKLDLRRLATEIADRK